MLPRPLLRGGTIGISAPAGPVKPERLTRAVEEIEASGYKVVLSANALGSDGLFSAPDEVRARELDELFNRNDVDAVFCARGGVGSSRLLPRLDWARIAASRKPFLGLSDITVLQWVLWKNTGAVSFTGPLAVEWDGALSDETRKQCWRTLGGDPGADLFAAFPGRGRVLRAANPSLIRAPLLPGNLTMITTLLGTPYVPDLRNVLLLVEDINEPPHRVDRMFWHLRHAGALDSLAGLLIGDFGDGTAAVDTAALEKSVLDATRGTSYPILIDVPFGHGQDRMTLPVGGIVALNTRELTMAWLRESHDEGLA